MAFETGGFGQGGFSSSGFGQGGFSGGGFGSEKNLTESQRELLPYLEQIQKEDEQKAQKIKPLQKIFDLLSRGQYLSANIVDEFLTSLKDDDPFDKDLKDVFLAAVQGIT